VDSISIGGDSHDVILDHCSAGWSVDECLSPSGGIADITVQWCLIAESLNHSVHSKGAHGYGSLVRAIGGVSLHHNLWAHNHGRNPRLGDNYNKPPYPTFDVRNNVMYNYGGTCSGLTGDIASVNTASAGPSCSLPRPTPAPSFRCAMGGWPVYRWKRPPPDRDGMPDVRETAHGLNQDEPSDAAADRDGDGYTNLEEYINQLAQTARQGRQSDLKR
jgi:hypothetical protein